MHNTKYLFRQVSSSDFGSLETVMKSAVKEKQPFVRLEMKKEDLLKMFEVGKIFKFWLTSGFILP